MSLSPARALIADDEPWLREALESALATVWPALKIVERCGDGTSALAALHRHRPEVAFLDIRMPGMSGLQVAQALAGEPDAPLCVFVTAYEAHAIEAFDQGAVDYLLKPLEADRLATTVSRLQTRLDERRRNDAGPALDAALLARLAALAGASGATEPPLRWLRASLRDEVRLIAIADVVAIEAADKYLRVLTASEEALIRMPLRSLMDRLAPDEFWQIHRGTVVRVAEIARTTRSLTGKLTVHLRSRPEHFEVSRPFAHQFKAD